MAERRMFARTIIDSDAFLDMPITARLLYYDLGMRADDDGFVNSPKKIMRIVGASQDDLNILIMRKFVLPFESGIVVIKHWKINNYIRTDRYVETKYKKEKSTLRFDENNAYTMNAPALDTNGIPMVGERDTQDRLGKDRLGKDRLGEREGRRFTPPSIEEVRTYCQERNNHIDPERFVDYYNSNGWKVGKNPMKDWKAVVRNWERRESQKTAQKKDTSFDSGKYNQKMKDVPVYTSRSNEQ